jgi:hypothetical protein
MRSALIIVLVALCSSCFSYTPLQNEPARQGKRLRVQLSTPRDVRLTNVTANEVVTVDGELVRFAPDTATLSVWMLKARSGYEFIGTGETVSLPRRDIAAVEERRLSILRSAAVAAAAGLAIVLIERAIGGSGGGGKEPGGGQTQ